MGVQEEQVAQNLPREFQVFLPVVGRFQGLAPLLGGFFVDTDALVVLGQVVEHFQGFGVAGQFTEQQGFGSQGLPGGIEGRQVLSPHGLGLAALAKAAREAVGQL